MCLPHSFFTSWKEVKKIKKLMERVKGLMDNVREHVKGVMDKNGHITGSISS